MFSDVVKLRTQWILQWKTMLKSVWAACKKKKKKVFTQCSDFLHGACSPTVSSSLNDVCCSGNALMWEIAVVCSMWQIIRHANQAEAAVESLIMVWVPYKGTSPPHIDPPGAPPDSGSPPLFTSTPHSPAALVPPDRQMDQRQRLKQWEERELSLGRIGWYGRLWHRGWSDYMWIWEGAGVLFIFGFPWSVSLGIIVVLVQLKINSWHFA